MKNIFNALFASLITLSTSAWAASIVPTDNLMCTRDYNAWGHASKCSCPSETAYERRLGSCVTGEATEIAVTGELMTGVNAIGGETTGYVLSDAKQGDFELILSNAVKAQLNDADTSGTVYQIEGEYLVVQGVESGERPTIIVSSIKPVLR